MSDCVYINNKISSFQFRENIFKGHEIKTENILITEHVQKFVHRI